MSQDTLALRAAGPAAPALRAEPVAVALDVAPMPNADCRPVLKLGLWILLLGFGGFLLWAFLAPLDEGIPAPGLVSVESSRKRVDHSTGGIIEQILVREGQSVQAGDALLELNETQWRSALQATRSQYQTALATLARLRAERDGATAVAFPDELRDTNDAEVAKIVATQSGLFRARRDALAGELRIIRESVRGLEQQLASLTQLRAGRETQIALFREQLDSYQNLKKSGFLSRNHVLEVERQLAEVQGRQSEDLANIAGINARLGELRMRGAQREAEYRREVEALLAEAQREVATLGERLTAQQDTFSRLVIRAPVAGRVVDLAYHTVGGVVKPGERILEIVPLDDELIVEARMAPQHIDRLHVGLPAEVHLEAYANRAEQPVVAGEVKVVSADALVDAKTGQPYFAVRVGVPRSEASKLGNIQLLPGMLATVMVKTGERTLAAYLARPLLRRFNTALTE
jgi:protease secretion system membrane fusion protein